MRLYRLLLPFAFLLISCASVAEPREQQSAVLPAAYPWAFFAGTQGLTAVNLDNGNTFKRDFVKGILPYTTTEYPAGYKLLAYIGWDLGNGCAFIDGAGDIKANFPGYSMHKLSSNALLGVRVREVIENIPADSTVTLIKLAPKLQITEMQNTLPLAPVGMLLNGDSGKLAEPMLLATYHVRESMQDFNYPWALDLRFTAVDGNANVLWATSLSTKQLVANLELIGNCNGVMLINARYGYTEGEYIGLDARSGAVLWQVSSTIVTLAQDDYPYTDFIYQLPLEVSGNTAWVPAYDSRYEEPGKCKIDLATGASWLDVDDEWVKRATAEWKKRQLPAEKPQAVEWAVGAREVLKLGNGRLSFLRNGVKIWERTLAPHFGTGLKLQQAGQKLLLLVETPVVGGDIGPQGLAHIVERATGQEPLPGLEEGAQYFQPLLIGGKMLLLDKEKTRLVPLPT